ncbi:MAG: hypothetical protein ACRC33_15405, partial [Gemmataceae bacterium]
GYAVRRIMKQMNQPDAPVVNFLFCGAPDDPATPRPELANLYATMTELNHFSDSAIPFSAQYGADGPRLVDEGAAYDNVYLLPQEHRTPEARRDSLSRMGSYLFHELTTPLGVRLDQTRMRRAQTPFRSLGTFGVWFPRGLLLRLAARTACGRLMEEWQAAGATLNLSEQAVLNAALTRALADPELGADALGARIAERAGELMDAPPRDALTKVLVTLEEQSMSPMAQDDPGGWAKQALTKVRDWLGSGVAIPGVAAMQQKRSPLTRALEAAAAALAKDWDERLGAVVAGLMDHGGRRLAVAEAAVARLMHYCDEATNAHAARVQKQSARAGQGQDQLDRALAECISGGGWSLFGGRSRRSLRVFVDHLAAYARQCLGEDTATVVLQFHAALRGRLADRMRDLGFCRQRLRHLQELLEQSADGSEGDVDNVSDTMTFTRTPGGPGWGTPPPSQLTPGLLSTEAYWQSIRESATNRVVLPEGETGLESAAKHFLASLTSEHWLQLDQVIGDQVLAARGGLLRLCLDSADMARHFATPLISQAIECLTDHLPITDVAQVEFAIQTGLPARITSYHANARPLVCATAPVPGPQSRGSGVRRVVMAGGPEQPEPRPARPKPGAEAQAGMLLIPASEAGRQFGEMAKGLFPELALVKVPGQADLMFCREQLSLRLEDLEPLLRGSRNAYHEACLTPQTSPHARFDLIDWTPLDP